MPHLPPAARPLARRRRYNGATKARILAGIGSNQLSGFWNGASGTSYHEGWMTGYANRHGSSWVLSSDTLTYYRSQRVDRTTGSGSIGASFRWSINMANEESDWAAAAVLFWNRTLTQAEAASVEAWLDNIYCVTFLSTCWTPPPPSPPNPPTPPTCAPRAAVPCRHVLLC